jgi:hypothetical protein
VFWLLRSVGLLAYVVFAAADHASITAESDNWDISGG